MSTRTTKRSACTRWAWIPQGLNCSLCYLLFIILLLLVLATSAFPDELDDILNAVDKEKDEAVVVEMEVPAVAPEGLPGETTRVVDPYTTNAPNPLFLSSMPERIWWDNRANARIPVLVTESVGLARRHQPVSIIHAFPEGISPESIRVVTPFGVEIPSQVRVLDTNKQEFEIVIVLDLNARDQLPLFVYYGDSPVDRPRPHAPDPCLGVEERENGIALFNSRLESEFCARAGQDNYPLWRVLKSHPAEYNMISPYPYGFTCGVPPGTPVQVIEDGPVRKTISYGAWGEHYTVSLYADSPVLYIIAATGEQSKGFWLPGGDTHNDVLCYESSEGLKRMPIEYAGANTEPRSYGEFLAWFSQGWFALLDRARQQGIGWFFDFPQGRPWLQTVSYGYWVTVAGSGQSAIYVADNALSEPCRDAYIAWKCPPIVSQGKPQHFRKDEPRIPMLGRDFILMHMAVERFHPRHDENTAREIVEKTRKYGANYVMFQGNLDYMQPSQGPDGKPGPALFDEVVRECHARNMGMAHGTCCGFKVASVTNIVARGADCIFLADEWGWGPGCDYYPLNEELRKQWLAGTGGWGHTVFSTEERAEFKKRYGADMPDAVDKDVKMDKVFADAAAAGEGLDEGLMEAPDLKAMGVQSPFQQLAVTDLRDPRHLAMFRMMIDANNLLMRDMAEAARAVNSNVLVTTVTSPSNLLVPRDLSAFNDLETLADSFTSVCLDLYENDGDWLNGMIKYARGAQGNRRSLFVISGYAGWDNYEMSKLNQHLQVMFGVNGMCYFVLDRLCSPGHAQGAKEAFNFIDYTGLGSFAARAWPLEFVGIVRDRDEFFASLERKETMNDLGTGSLYEQSVKKTFDAMTFYIPANIISAKRLKSELEGDYKLIIVPDNPGMSDENAELLKQFVERGGHLILELGSVKNEILAELAGVSLPGEKMAGEVQIRGVKQPLEDWSTKTGRGWQPIKARPGTEVLAVLGGDQPALTMSTSGKGKVFCSAFKFGPCVRRSDPPAAALRKLVLYAIGYAPVTVEPRGTPVWSTVLTDGERYVICSFNCSNQRVGDFDLVLKGFPEDLRNLVSLRTGHVYQVEKGVAHGLSLWPAEPDYFMLTSSVSKPLARRQVATPISQSLNPGMEFLDLPSSE